LQFKPGTPTSPCPILHLRFAADHHKGKMNHNEIFYLLPYLHDIGNMGIPKSILRKKGPLTQADQQIVSKYPETAYNLLKEIATWKKHWNPSCHQEKWDGSGYLRRLLGNEIPHSLPASSRWWTYGMRSRPTGLTAKSGRARKCSNTLTTKQANIRPADCHIVFGTDRMGRNHLDFLNKKAPGPKFCLALSSFKLLIFNQDASA